LLDAAEKVFAAKGFEGATIDSVAEEAGFTKGAIYAHFEGKDGLFLALLDRRWADMTRELQGLAGLLGLPGPKEGQADQGRFLADIEANRNWNLIFLEYFLYALRNKGAEKEIAARYRALRDDLKRDLDAALAARGSATDTPTRDIPWILFGLGLGLSIQAYLDPADFPPGAYERFLSRLFSISDA
jgi:AcrR family transcriptional regulator